jgi:transcriptional regulator with XRE-family HTH domain
MFNTKECNTMERKDMYSIQELYDNLEISMLELSRRAEINPGTLSRIKKGRSARRPTVNKLLRTFSELYGIRLSLTNVFGIHLEGEKPQASVAEKAEKPSVSQPVAKHTQAVSEGPKREYKRKDTGLPAGAILATDFARNHGVKRETFRDHMLIGLGQGSVWGEEPDPIMGVRDHVEFSERPKPGRPKETERYLTPDQQKAALEFWKRHDAAFEQCNRFECWCHTLKLGEE